MSDGVAYPVAHAPGSDEPALLFNAIRYDGTRRNLGWWDRRPAGRNVSKDRRDAGSTNRNYGLTRT